MSYKPSSVCLSICKHLHKSLRLLQTNGWIATEFAHDSPRWACIHGVLKVKVEVKGRVIGAYFVISQKNKISSSPRKWLDREQTPSLTSLPFLRSLFFCTPIPKWL